VNRRAYAIAPCALFCALLLGFAIDRIAAYGEVLRGVWVDDVALSGLDPAEAERALAALDERLRRAPLSVRIGDQPFEVSPAEIGFRVDVDATLARAEAEGRAENPVRQLGWWLARFASPVRIPAVGTLDPDALDAWLDRSEAQAIADRPYSGGVVARGGAPVAEPPRRGRRIERERARREITNALAAERRGTLALPLEEVRPELDPKLLDEAAARARVLVSGPVELHLEERDPTDDSQALSLRFEPTVLLRALTSRITGTDTPRVELQFEPAVIEERLGLLRRALEKPPRDATIVIDERDRPGIVPSRAGTLVDARLIADAVLEAAASPAKVGALPIVRGAPPERSTDALIALRIRRLVSKFTTHHECCQPRVKNIHRIADLVDGTIVEPGGIVSLNALAGPRTLKNGFVMAPSIEDGEMVDALGGGASQFATTFFNALFHGGYDILERQPHSYWFPRYPMGHEATLSWPKPDVIFRNDTDAGLFIDTSYTETSITVKLFGDNGGRKVQARVSARQDIVKPPVELIANDDVPPDDEKTKEGGMIGWSVIVSRVLTFPDGSKKEETRKVTYKPRVRRVEVHSCRIPEGEPGYTGEKCPVPETDGGDDAS
jgi:vancomycin resistance protein YoaR